MVRYNMLPGFGKLKIKDAVLQTAKSEDFRHQLQVCRFPKTTISFNNSLKGVTEYKKGLYLQLWFYHSQRIQIKTSQRKECLEQKLGLGRFQI